MLKYKGSVTIVLLLAFAALALPCIQSYSFFDFLFNYSLVTQSGASPWMVIVVSVYLLWHLLTIFLVPYQKNPYLKAKTFGLCLADLGGFMLIILVAAKNLIKAPYKLSFFAFIPAILLVLAVSLSLAMSPEKKAKKAAKPKEKSKPEEIKAEPVEGSKPEEKTSFENPQPAAEETVLDVPANIIDEEEVQTEKPASQKPSGTKSFGKRFYKILFLINLLFLISLFFTWNSDITKTKGIIIFLSGHGFFDILSRLVLLLAVHILITLVLFFNGRRYFLIATLINATGMILAVVRASELIGFVNLAMVPIFDVILSFAVYYLVYMYRREMNRRKPGSVHLTSDLKAYFSAAISMIGKIFNNLKAMVLAWKDDTGE